MSDVDLYRTALGIVASASFLFGSALIAIVLWNARRIIVKQDSAESNISTRLDTLQQYMQSELRSLDVRLSVVEAFVLPERPRATPIMRFARRQDDPPPSSA